MKTETLNKRLARRYGGARNTKAYQVVNDLINGRENFMIRGQVIRPVIISGSGKYTNYVDYSRDIGDLLNLIGVRFKNGNDAPRGGKTGNYIEIKTSIRL